MLASEKLVAFVSATSADHARAFYRDKLGLRLVSEDGFALVFDSGGAPLRVSLAKEVKPAPYTVLGWQVKNAKATVEKLAAAGVVFERYTGMGQDNLGIWSSPSGAKVAWFKDPDGNLLSVSEH